MLGSDHSAACLAYLGDAAFELWVRKTLFTCGVATTSSFNTEALLFVTAKAQSAALTNIEPLLTEEESDAYKRGRNAHVTPPKSASAAEYHRATGLEALIGALYIEGQESRIDQLLNAAFADVIADVTARHGDKDRSAR